MQKGRSVTDPRTIYVDVDDVLSETCRGFLELLRKEFGRTVAFEDVRHFDLTRSFSMEPAQLEEFMERAHEPEILAAMQPMKGAARTLRRWSERGWEIEVVTGRPPRTRAATTEWLRRHEMPCTRLTFVDKYGLAGAHPEFREAVPLAELAQRRFALAVEDSAATAAYLARHEVAPVLLIDRPWNRELVAEGVRRCAAWEEIAESVDLDR